MSIGLSLNALQLELSDRATVSEGLIFYHTGMVVKGLRVNLFDRLGYHTKLWWLMVKGLTSYTWSYNTGLQ